MTDLTVSHIHNAMQGAPALTNAAGAFLSLVDALLISGWNIKPITGGSVSSGMATIMFSEGSFEAGAVVLIGDTGPVGLNTRARVLSAAPGQITVATTSADQAIPPGGTVRYAPAGSWEVVHAGDNKKVYRSTDPRSPDWCYRIDDQAGNVVRWRAYRQMDDVDTGLGPCPTDAQISGGGYFVKFNVGSQASGITYHAVADGGSLHVAAGNAPYPISNRALPMRGFGVPVPIFGAILDPWAAYISCGLFNSGGYGYGALNQAADNYLDDGTGGANYCMGANGVAGAVPTNIYAESGNYNGVSGGDGKHGALSDRLLLSRLLIGNRSHAVPGVYYVPQSSAFAPFQTGQILTGAGPMQGRRMLAIRAGGRGSTADAGVYFVDLTGPWR